MPYAVKIDNFEGPLDLLLHLIRKHEMDIHDIPMAEITAQYLASLDVMQRLNLEVAGEFLVVAATLIHIKSRLLLPETSEAEAEDDEADPRAELVRRLLDYQRYQDAALSLDTLPQLQRDVFARAQPAADLAADDPWTGCWAPGVFDLLEACRGLLAPPVAESAHEVTVSTWSVAERISAIVTLLQGRTSLAFAELLPAGASRQELVVNFLAALELVRLRRVRLRQEGRYGPIWLSLGAQALKPLAVDEESFACL